MTEKSELIVAAAFGVAFGSAFCAGLAALLDRRPKSPPPLRFRPRAGADFPQLALEAPAMNRTSAAFGAMIAAAYRLIGKLSG